MPSRFLRALLLSAAVYPPGAASAQGAIVASRADARSKEIGGDDRVSVSAGATLSVDGTALRWNRPSTGLRIDNDGVIESIESGGRAINGSGSADGERSIILDNRAGGVIRAESDAFRINIDAAQGTITVRNAGAIMSLVDGQALDFDAVTGSAGRAATITIANEAGGWIEAAGADGVRPGAGAAIVNAGVITSGGVVGDKNDAIDWQGRAGTVVNRAGGIITGQRHGITSDLFVDVVNEKVAVIIGRNGSGIGSDGNGRVVNHGRITGAYLGIGDGDGDGVDIDAFGIVDNYGLIEGTGAGGVDNGAEGVLSTGGGVVTNHEGGTITGVVRGVTTGNGTVVRNFGLIASTGVDTLPVASDGIGGGGGATVVNAATGAIIGDARGIFADGGFSITNDGLIHGGDQGVLLIRSAANTIVNTGTIESFYAGVQAQGGDNLVVNSGRITGGRYAILFQGGRNTLELRGGSVLIGTVDGGAGANLLRLTNGAVFDQAVNFQRLEITGDAIVRGGNSFDQITIAPGSTLTIGDGGTTGGVDGPIRNDGVIRLNRADALTISAPISGTGTLLQVGGGSSTLSGNNDFTGPVLVSVGALRLSGGEALQDAVAVTVEADAALELLDDETVGSVTGQGSVLLGDHRLTVTQAAAESGFDGAIGGAGGLDKAGAGAFRLTGDNGFSGDTRIVAGRLIVDGALSRSTVVLAPGGTLAGSGRVAAVRGEGGVIAPGSGIGQLTVAGDVTLSAADTYQVDVDANGAADRLLTNGRTTLNGATLRAQAAPGRYRGRTSFAILAAEGGVAGAFGTVVSDLAFLTPTLVYGANDVTLVMTRNDVDFASTGRTGNQRAASRAVQALGPDNDLFEEALFLSDTGAPNAFGNLSGEIYADVASGTVENAHEVQRQLLGRAAPDRDGFYGWGHGIGSWGRADATARNERLKTKLTGLLGGVGFKMNGFDLAAGGGVSDADFDAVGRADVESTIAVVEAGYRTGAFFANLGGSYGWNDGRSRRTATIGILGGSVSGDIDGNTRQVFGRIGYTAALGQVALTPFAGANHVRVHTDAIVEQGGVTALTLAADTREVTYANLGVAVATASGARAIGGRVSPFGSVAWRHGGGDTRQTYRAVLAGSAFDVMGPALAGNAAEVAAGLDFSTGALRINAGYQGLLSGHWTRHAARIAAGIAF